MARRIRDLDPVSNRQASLDGLADVLWIATERLLDVMRSRDLGSNEVDDDEASIGPEGVKQIKDGWRATMLTLARRAPDELWRTADDRIEVLDLSRRDVAIARAFELYVLMCDNLHWLASPDVVLDIVGNDWTVFVEDMPRAFRIYGVRRKHAEHHRQGGRTCVLKRLEELSEPITLKDMQRRYARFYLCPSEGCNRSNMSIYPSCYKCGCALHEGPWAKARPEDALLPRVVG